MMKINLTPMIALADLATIGTENDLVPLGEFGHRADAISRICQQIRPNAQTPEDLMGADLFEVRLLECGLVLRMDGAEKLAPNCCSDLSGLQDLRECLDSTDDSWRQIWIGHPWVSARRVGEMIEISHPHEESEPQTALAVPLGELRTAVDQAYVEVRAFLQWMEKSFAVSLTAAECKQVAERMLGLAIDL